jgi:hypothetical protein
MRCTTSRTLSLIALVLLASACAAPGAGGGGRYDPNARETLGRVLARKDTGANTQQARSITLVPIGGLIVPMPLDRAVGPLPVLEYKIKLEDGRTVSVFTWYQFHDVGNCVKLFESPRSDYPRLINFHGCKE